MWPLFRFGILISFSVLLVGCAIGPKYIYTQQIDSAIITESPKEGESVTAETSEVYINYIDGLAASTGLAIIGIKPETDHAYLAPGRHVLGLVVQHLEAVFEDSIPEHKRYTANGTLESVFIANRKYLITASLNENTFKITLWDETDSSRKPIHIVDCIFEAKFGYDRDFENHQDIDHK